MRSVVVLEDAVEDIELARNFYDRLAPGIGKYCAQSLLLDVESLVDSHGVHPVYFGVHRMLATRFPFAIYYGEQPVRTEVIAVLDLRRDPGWIRKELQGRRL